MCMQKKAGQGRLVSLGLLWLCFLCGTCWKGHKAQHSHMHLFLMSPDLVLWNLA